MKVQKYNLAYFSRKIKIILGPIIDFYAYKKSGVISLHYFDKEINVGDILNPYLIEKIFNKKVIKRQKGYSPHVLAIGSVMHDANENSYIWGSGFISKTDLPKELDANKIKAVRGKESVKALKEYYNISIPNIALGDPAVLMPLYYKSKAVNKKYKVGIVPHYIDIEKIPLIIRNNEHIKIIDVQQDPEDFIDDISECDAILSSSLHGLILADAYHIPNKWIVLSDRLIGGSFKFTDYYSTTTNPQESCVEIACGLDLENLVLEIDQKVTVKEYIYSREELISAFPSELVS